MATSKEMQAQIEQLQLQLVEVRKQEIATAVDQVRKLIREHGLTLDDIGRRAFAKGAQRAAVKGGKSTVNPPKYRDPASGATWTGKGRVPTWLVEAKNEGREAEFLIAGATKARKPTPAKKGASKRAGMKRVPAKGPRKAS